MRADFAVVKGPLTSAGYVQCGQVSNHNIALKNVSEAIDIAYGFAIGASLHSGDPAIVKIDDSTYYEVFAREHKPGEFSVEQQADAATALQLLADLMTPGPLHPPTVRGILKRINNILAPVVAMALQEERK